MSTYSGDRWLMRVALILLVAALGLAAFVESSSATAREDTAEEPLYQHDAHDYAPLSLKAARQSDPAPLLGNLGAHHHPISTKSELAQRYFDEGLILAYGFNHAEAIRSYQDALKVDPACAMCYWGIAYALGPNINAPMQDAAVPEAYAALGKARALAPSASQQERDYIQALAARYAPEPVADRSALDLAYAEAMQAVAQRYPDDLDAATLAAEAFMDLTPWKFWTKDGQPTAYTEKIVGLLESVMARNPEHPGANHFYIHAVEASRTPKRALPSADRLAQLAPGAGHLVHMPAHIYWRVGRYHDAVRTNEHAIHADESHFTVGGTADRNAHSMYKLTYYPHNIHFLFAAAHSEGQSALAMQAARKLVSKIPDEAYRQLPPLEDFRPMPLYALVRFGRWAEVLEEPRPPEDLQFSTAIWHWARGMAYVRLGQLDKAEIEHVRLAAIAQTDAMQQQDLASFPKAATILEIAANILGGELAGAYGYADTQISRLEAAVKIQDDLPYIEPPAWFFPVRQSLGAALLQAGRAAEAEAVYREDLRQYPRNGWSLYGLAESLRAQGKLPEAAQAQAQFEDAWKHADVTLTSSRF